MDLAARELGIDGALAGVLHGVGGHTGRDQRRFGLLSRLAHRQQIVRETDENSVPALGSTV